MQNSPTLSMAMTQAGMILGTAAYMSPEQAKGKPADRRADIWAFGVVFYEMLAGGQTFTGDTAAETLASVLKETISFDRLPADTPPAVRGLLEPVPGARFAQTAASHRRGADRSRRSAGGTGGEPD